MTRKNTFAAVLMLGACAVARAQSYYFDGIPGLPDQPSVQIELNAPLLGFAAAATSANDPGMATLLESIEGVRVRVYRPVADAGQLESFVDDASGRLERDGWHRTVEAQDGEHKVRVYARLDGNAMNGVVIMALGEQGAAFVDVAGSIRPEQLGRIIDTAGVRDLVGDIPELASSNARRVTRD